MSRTTRAPTRLPIHVAPEAYQVVNEQQFRQVIDDRLTLLEEGVDTLTENAANANPTTDTAIARFDGDSGLLQDSSVLISDTDAMSGVTRITPVINEAYDLITNALATTYYYSGTVANVATGKNLHAFTVRPTISDMTGTAVFRGYDFDVTITDSDAGINAYGCIGALTIGGAGTAKALYGRAVSATGHTGTLIANTMGCDVLSTTAFSTTLQLTNQTEVGAELDHLIWAASNDGNTVNVNRGVFFDEDHVFSVGIFTVRLNASPGAGDFLLLEDSSEALIYKVTPAGRTQSTGYLERTGTGGSYGSNYFNFSWTGSAADLYIDNSNVGTFTLTSDYRTKRNVEDMADGAIARVMGLRPVTYQRADFGTIFKASDDIREGFIAHELAEVIPSAVEGEKDDSVRIQSLKPDAICAVLTKALQEAVTRIRDLETRLSTLEGRTT